MPSTLLSWFASPSRFSFSDKAPSQHEEGHAGHQERRANEIKLKIAKFVEEEQE